MKNKKGISLIILAITIIVMIIIAGAVIISLTENDVIDEAKGSVKDWNTKAAREQLMLLAIGSMDSNADVDFNKLDSSLPEGIEKVEGHTGIYQTSQGDIFRVTKSGTVTQLPEIPEI